MACKAKRPWGGADDQVIRIFSASLPLGVTKWATKNFHSRSEAMRMAVRDLFLLLVENRWGEIEAMGLAAKDHAHIPNHVITLAFPHCYLERIDEIITRVRNPSSPRARLWISRSHFLRWAFWICERREDAVRAPIPAEVVLPADLAEQHRREIAEDRLRRQKAEAESRRVAAVLHLDPTRLEMVDGTPLYFLTKEEARARRGTR